mgnify:CR=1 FL=1
MWLFLEIVILLVLAFPVPSITLIRSPKTAPVGSVIVLAESVVLTISLSPETAFTSAVTSENPDTVRKTSLAIS